jgi:hypothetical protein
VSGEERAAQRACEPINAYAHQEILIKFCIKLEKPFKTYAGTPLKRRPASKIEEAY